MKINARIYNIAALVILAITMLGFLYLLHFVPSFGFFYALIALNAGILIGFGLMAISARIRISTARKSPKEIADSPAIMKNKIHPPSIQLAARDTGLEPSSL